MVETSTNVEADILEEEPQVPSVRNEKGQFLKGVSGNPAGRAKGTKNRITLERLLLEEKLREALSAEGPKLMRKAVRMALSGNDRVMRVLLDKMLATPRGDDDSQAADRDITVVVKNLITQEIPVQKGELLEGEVVRFPLPQSKEPKT